MARRPRRITPIDQLRVVPFDSGISDPDNVTGNDGGADPYGGPVNQYGHPNDVRKSHVPADDTFQPGDDELVNPDSDDGITWGSLFARGPVRQERQPHHINLLDQSILTPTSGIDAPAPRRFILANMDLERTEALGITTGIILKAKGPNHFLRLLRGYARNIRQSTNRDLQFVYMNANTTDNLRTRLASRQDVIPPSALGTICGCIVRCNDELKLGEFYATIQ